MSSKRRDVTVHDTHRWVFNRMAEDYDARPPYPPTLIDTLVESIGSGSRVLDIGAGIGHLALPLATRGFNVTAVEPAQAMLGRLEQAAGSQGLDLQTTQAAAEDLPFEDAAFDVAVIADALHFISPELAAAQLHRVLARRGVLAIVTCEYSPTPFMHGIEGLVAEIADRRPRDVRQRIRRLAARADVKLTRQWSFQQEVPVDYATLERILRSISFIGPAFGPARFETLRQGVRAMPYQPVWARTFTLNIGRRR